MIKRVAFLPGLKPNTVRTADGQVLSVPAGWSLLPPGDAALTRRVKAAGEHWLVQEKKGRKVFSRGVWAPAATIERIRAELEIERSTEGFAKKREADARRRERAQAEYVDDFHEAVVAFLAFAGSSGQVRVCAATRPNSARRGCSTHVPEPDEVIFRESWAKGEHFRSGCLWTLGRGKVFYFRPGHETFSVYLQREPLQIIENAVRWLSSSSDSRH